MLNLGVVQRKGGVGKSTSVLNLAAEFAARGQRVLCVDADPQGTLTVFAGLDPDQLKSEDTLLAALVPEVLGLPDDFLPDPFETGWGADLIPASADLSQAESVLAEQDTLGPNQRLASALAGYADDYDLALMDSGPSLGKLTVNVLCASDHLLVPLGSDFASAKGLDRLQKTLALVRRYERPNLQITAAFRTQVRKTRHHDEVGEALREQLGDQFVEVAIPLAVSVQDSQVKQQALRTYDPSSKAAVAYGELAEEILVRIGQKTTRSVRKVA